MGSSAPPPVQPPSQPPATAAEPQKGDPKPGVEAAALAATSPRRGPEPLPENATLTAPELFRVSVETTKGSFVIEIDRALGPHGADRFFNLVELGYFQDIAFFRAIAGFMVQFGLHGDPSVSRAWKDASIPDDPVATSNTRGTLSFAKMASANSATTQLFINLTDNTQLDGMGFSPIGRVVEGMDVVDALYTGYGEGAPSGKGPAQKRIERRGNAYLEDFPNLDRITSMRIIEAR